MKVNIKSFVAEGKTVFVVSYRDASKKRIRRRFKSVAEVEAFREALLDQSKSDTLYAVEKAKEHGFELRRLVDLVTRRPVTVSQMADITLKTKVSKNCRPSYIRALEHVLESFCVDYGRSLLSMTTLEDVERWISKQKGMNGRPPSSHTIAGLLDKVSTMFSLAVKRGLIDSNPVDRFERPILDALSSVIFTPSEVRDLLWVGRKTDPGFLAWLVLGLFAGIRPEELMKLRWSDIDLVTGEVVINLSVAKTRRRRVIDMEPILIEWLKECPPTGVYVFESGYSAKKRDGLALDSIKQAIDRHRRNLSERAGVKWHTDILRKTCASYLARKYPDENKVAAILGNSPAVMHRYYKAIVSRKDCEEFWSLNPSAVPNDPIALPKGGTGKKKPGKLIP